MSKSESKLKPCPFCGGKASIIKANHYYVQCSVCEASGKAYITSGKGTSKTDKEAAEEVVNYWNNRIGK